MKKAYPIGTPVLIGGIEHIISGVAFYPDNIKYLLFRMDEGKIIEEWWSDFYFTVGETQKKIGFEV